MKANNSVVAALRIEVVSYLNLPILLTQVHNLLLPGSI